MGAPWGSMTPNSVRSPLHVLEVLGAAVRRRPPRGHARRGRCRARPRPPPGAGGRTCTATKLGAGFGGSRSSSRTRCWLALVVAYKASDEETAEAVDGGRLRAALRLDARRSDVPCTPFISPTSASTSPANTQSRVRSGVNHSFAARTDGDAPFARHLLERLDLLGERRDPHAVDPALPGHVGCG